MLEIQPLHLDVRHMCSYQSDIAYALTTQSVTLKKFSHITVHLINQITAVHVTFV